MLVLIKLIHTIVWVFFVACIAAIPTFAHFGRFDASLIAFAFVLGEVAVLGLNRMRCPLTDIAAKYTEDRRDHFDIFLPLIIARYNKHVFGPLFVVGTAYAIFVWLTQN